MATYILQLQYADSQKRFTKISDAKKAVVSKLRDNYTWALRFAHDTLDAITDGIARIESLTDLSPGEDFADEVVVDKRTDTRFVYRIVREA